MGWSRRLVLVTLLTARLAVAASPDPKQHDVFDVLANIDAATDGITGISVFLSGQNVYVEGCPDNEPDLKRLRDALTKYPDARNLTCPCDVVSFGSIGAITLETGRSRILDVQDVERAEVFDPLVAALVNDDKEPVEVIGLESGQTTLTLTARSGERKHYIIDVHDSACVAMIEEARPLLDGTGDELSFRGDVVQIRGKGTPQAVETLKAVRARFPGLFDDPHHCPGGPRPAPSLSVGIHLVVGEQATVPVPGRIEKGSSANPAVAFVEPLLHAIRVKGVAPGQTTVEVRNFDVAMESARVTVRKIGPREFGALLAGLEKEGGAAQLIDGRLIISPPKTDDPRAAARVERLIQRLRFAGELPAPVLHGFSRIFDAGGPIARAEESDRRIATATILGNELVVQGKSKGVALLRVWPQRGPELAYAVEVVEPYEEDRAELHDLLLGPPSRLEIKAGKVYMNGDRLSPEDTARLNRVLEGFPKPPTLLEKVKAELDGIEGVSVRLIGADVFVEGCAQILEGKRKVESVLLAFPEVRSLENCPYVLSSPDDKIRVRVGQVRTLLTSGTIKRVKGGDDAILDVRSHGLSTVLITGMSEGTTNLIAWLQGDGRDNCLVKVVRDPPASREKVEAEDRVTTIDVELSGQAVLEYTEDIARIEIANTQIAEASVREGHRVLVLGHALGKTQLLLWTSDGTQHVYLVAVRKPYPPEVQKQLDQLRTKLRSMGVTLHIAGDSVTAIGSGLSWASAPAQALIRKAEKLVKASTPAE